MWNSLASANLEVPEQVGDELSSESVATATQNLRSASEGNALRQAFDDGGLDCLFVKGVTLAKLAYGTIATKAAVDIDILIEPTQLGEATALLQQQGYRLSQPGENVDKDQLERWHRLRKESTWLNEDRGLQIDLHTRLSDSPHLIPAVGLDSPRQTVEIAPGIGLPTLARDELFAYLAVHGASSAWFRLKWITDFAALVHGCSASELKRLYDRSQLLAAGRSAAQALLLADRIYGTLANAPDLKRSLEGDGRARLLAGIAFRLLAGSADPTEPTARSFGTLAIHYSQFLLLPGPRFKLSELVRQARAALA